MKILITADLHLRNKWFAWLLAQAPYFDLIAIAGDLLDMFSSTPRLDQTRDVSRWLRELSKITRVAVCSGNHDIAGRQITKDRAPVYEWLARLGDSPRICTDGSTHLLEEILVTELPYHCSEEQKSIWLDRGISIRRSRGTPWFVLHHVPPIAYPGSTQEESEAAKLLIRYQPDYFVSAHSHQFPYFDGHRWAMNVGTVTVLFPGQLLSADTPNHILVDTATRRMSWQTASQIWIPEK